MPCGYPKDPAATKAKRQATAAAKRAEALRIRESDDALAQLRAKLTGEEAPADVLKRVFNRQQQAQQSEEEDVIQNLRNEVRYLEGRVEEFDSALDSANRELKRMKNYVFMLLDLLSGCELR